MTPPDDLTDAPVDPDELAVHAVLDGEADADQRRRVARDPALVARVAALRTAGEALARPVEPPSAAVLDALRTRAIDVGLADPVTETPADGADADLTAADLGADVPDDDSSSIDVTPDRPAGAAPDLAPDVAELAPRRTRRRRRLPPLPAVAAVVFLLVLAGSALILTDGRGDDDQAAPDATATEQADDAGAAESAAGADGAVDPAVAEARARLSAAAATTYDSEAELLDALRSVDPSTLDLSGTGAPVARSGDAAGANDEAGAEQGDDEVPLSGDAPTPEATTSVAGTLDPTDPDVERCYTVLRSITPTLGPTEAAAIVLVDEVPVLVLSNPVGASEDEQASTRLSTVDAVSCVPGDAVQR